MSTRIVSVSGLRGIVGDGLDPVYVAQFAAAFGTLCEGRTVVVSRDGRQTGSAIKHGVLSALNMTGCRVLDAGIAATPTCGVLVTENAAAGGLQITASHNPVEWNGLKPFSADGSVLDEATGRRLLEILESKSFAFANWDCLGDVEPLDDPSTPHLKRVLNRIDIDAVRNRRFRVVLDACHGSGGVMGPRLLESLGCQPHLLGGTPDGRFEHPPEPIAANLTGLRAAVKDAGADVGFAQDPDADRLAVVDGTGRYIGEELTLALCTDYVLARTPGPVVINTSTSRIIADIAEKYGQPLSRASVGEAHVVAGMKAISVVVGGEGNGGVIDPQVGYVRDSFVAMAYILSGMAAEGRSLAEWVDSLPSYTIVKDKLTCPHGRVQAACDALQAAYSDAEASLNDGLRLDWDDRWVQVRASNTEPILRVIAEAADEQGARQLCSQAMEIVRRAVG